MTRATTTQALAHGTNLGAAVLYAMALVPYIGAAVLISMPGGGAGLPARTVGGIAAASLPILLLIAISVVNAWFFVAGVERSRALCRRVLWGNAAAGVLIGGVGAFALIGFGPCLLLVAPIVIGQLGGSAFAAWRVLRVHEPRPGFCWNCEYEVGDLPRCPECGTPTPNAGVSHEAESNPS